ncbi:UGSC family (seleno)protein [Jatrophihabitans sp. DSM 45814]
MATGLLVVPPVTKQHTSERSLIERPASPDGLVVGLREFWFNYDRFTLAFEGLLKNRFKVAGVARIDGTHPRTGRVLQAWQEFNRSVDWALVGFGACGGCAPWAVMDALELESNGVPTVTLISEDLVGVARTTARTKGYPQLRILTLPHYIDDMDDDAIVALAETTFDDIIAALTRPIG